MGRIRYLIIENYKGPNVKSAIVSTPKYGDFNAEEIKYKGNKLLIGFNMREDTILNTLTIFGDNGTYTTDVSNFTGASSDIKYYDGPVYKKTKNTNLSWWEFGERDEFFIKSIILLPFRLVLSPVIWFISTIVNVIVGIVGLAIFIPLEIIKFFFKAIISILIITISLILLPIKIVLTIITFGYYKGFEQRFIDRLDNIWN